MSSAACLTKLSLSAFADALAARTPTPGGGSLAAYLVACGAATVSMSMRFTSGEKYAAVEQDMARHAEELDRLRARALALVDADSAAYDAVTAAFALPKSTDTEKSVRTAAVQAALRGALEVPLETMQLAHAVLRLARERAADVNPNLASDCGSGALAAAAGLESARANVAINAASIKDAEYVQRKRAEARTLADEGRAALVAVHAAIAKHIGD